MVLKVVHEPSFVWCPTFAPFLSHRSYAVLLHTEAVCFLFHLPLILSQNTFGGMYQPRVQEKKKKKRVMLSIHECEVEQRKQISDTKRQLFPQTSPLMNSTEAEGETVEDGDVVGVASSRGEVSCCCCSCKGVCVTGREESTEGTGEKSKTNELRESRGVRGECGGVRSTKINAGAQACLSSSPNCSER